MLRHNRTDRSTRRDVLLLAQNQDSVHKLGNRARKANLRRVAADPIAASPDEQLSELVHHFLQAQLTPRTLGSVTPERKRQGLKTIPRRCRLSSSRDAYTVGTAGKLPVAAESGCLSESAGMARMQKPWSSAALVEDAVHCIGTCSAFAFRRLLLRFVRSGSHDRLDPVPALLPEEERAR